MSIFCEVNIHPTKSVEVLSSPESAVVIIIMY